MTVTKFSHLTPAERSEVETCIHEAGHALVAAVYGATIREVIVARSKVTGQLGRTTFDALDDDPATARWRAASCYAGPWAHARFVALTQGRDRPTSHDIGRIMQYSGDGDGLKLQRLGGTDRPAVAEVLIRCWPNVVSLAKVLHRTGHAGHAHVLACLGIEPGGDPAAVDLALMNIRAGAVPGSFTVTTPQTVAV